MLNFNIETMTLYNIYGIMYSFSTILIEPDDLTDHIPVEDNPVYVAMKRIDLMKNSAYETVIVAKRPLNAVN